MTCFKTMSAALMAGAAILPVPALAQAMTATEAAQMRAELETLRTQMRLLTERLDKAEAAQAVAPAPVAPAPAPVMAAAPVKPDHGIKWKGAPEISNDKGWSFKPRGRLQWDVATVGGPDGLASSQSSLGFSNKVRRAYFGAQGTMPGGFGYRLEADFADGAATLTDAYLTYDKGPWNFTVGHQKTLATLEDMSSDLDTGFAERAAFIQAFGFERRMGLTAGYAKGDVMVNAGVFTDDTKTLGATGGDTNNSFSLAARAAWMPKFGNTQLHLGASAQLREMNNLATVTSNYRARPATRTSDARFIGFAALNVSRETGFGLEAMAINGPFHAMAETYWFKPQLASTGQTATFFGGYGEVGYFLTRGDSRPYKKGAYSSAKPAHAVGAGGPGAIELVLRYDHLNMRDASVGLNGGRQYGYLAGLSWVPAEHFKLLLSYGHLKYRDAIIAAGSGNNYSVDTLVSRAQFDF